MTPTEAFKYGFLLQCAQDGLTQAETDARIHAALQKTAADPTMWDNITKVTAAPIGAIKTLGSGVIGGVTDLAKWLGPYGLAAAIGGPVVLGALAGGTAAEVTNDEYTKDEARNDEELAEYYRATDQLERARRRREASARL